MLHVGALSSVDALCLLRLWHATPGCIPTPKHGCLSHPAQAGPALTWTPQLHLGYPHWCIHSWEVLLPSSVPVAPNEHLPLLAWAQTPDATLLTPCLATDVPTHGHPLHPDQAVMPLRQPSLSCRHLPGSASPNSFRTKLFRKGKVKF